MIRKKSYMNTTVNRIRATLTSLRMGIVVASVLCIAGAILVATRPGAASSTPRSAAVLGGPSPASGTLTPTSGTITYTDSVGSAPNPTAVALGAPDCTLPNSCSQFSLTINAPASASFDPTKFNVVIQETWAIAANDYDTFVEDTTGKVVGQNTSTADPETILLPVPAPGTIYNIILVMATGAPQAYTGTVSLVPKPASASAQCQAISPAENCTPPRYQNFPAPQGLGDNAGEPSIGVDWNPNVAKLKHDKVNTGGVAFFTSGPNELRSSFDDCSSPAVNLWEDVSAVTTQQFALSDPIGFVDHYGKQPSPGRIFTLDLIGGEGNSLGSFSDDDGGTYKPGGNGGPIAGPDHETLGGGPYNPNSTPAPPPSIGYPNAIYYCSQNIVAEAQCSRSDDGGQTFGPGVPIFNPAVCTGGIHGHVKVGPDGTVYVPNSSCGTTGIAGAAISTDNGLTWTEGNVPGSTGSLDPSVGIGQNNVGLPAGQKSNTAYLGWISGDGHPHIADSRDQGKTWENNIDVGAAIGIQSSVFPVVVAGDDNRAAYGFLGTTTAGNSSTDTTFKGVWHLYIATTYDGGKSYITIDATPDDPVQTGDICVAGTLCGGGRNLLDFNDFTVDKEGRGLLGYADGCVNCSNTFQSQSNSSHATIARQSGGRRLFAAFDPVEPAVPAAPQGQDAVRDSSGVLVSWLEPDNGGSPITGYKVYRGTTSGAETFLKSVSGVKNTKLLDTTALTTSNYFYRVTAVNAIGEGTFCRELNVSGAQPLESACSLPFITVQGPGSKSVPDTPVTEELFIQRVGVGEPFTTCTDQSITFLMKVQTLSPAPPPNGEWQVLFNVPDTTGTNRTLFVSFDTNNNPTGSFNYGFRGPSPTGGTFDNAQCGATGPCPVTGTTSPDGTIMMKLDVSHTLNFAPAATGTGFSVDIPVGTQLNSIQGTTTLLIGAAGTGLLETVSTTTGDGKYTTRGNIACAAKPPVAVLSANPLQGPAPLTVNFDASKSKDTNPCTTLTTYTLDFGDGNPPVTQSAPAFTHTYTKSGDFPARLTVKDSGGEVSANTAQVLIHVTDASGVHRIVGSGTIDSAKNFPFQFDVKGNLTGFLSYQDKLARISLSTTSITSFASFGTQDNGGANFGGTGTLQDRRAITFTVVARNSDTKVDSVWISVKDLKGNVISSRSTANLTTGDVEYIP